MIQVTKLNGQTFVLNVDQIETIEGTPDTMITLTSGRKYVVREAVDELLQRIADFGLPGQRPRSRTLQIVHRSTDTQPAMPEGTV